MKKKFLLVTMPNGDQWEVPAEIVIRNRVEFYAKLQKFAEGSKEWQLEWENSDDEDEIKNWAGGNMDWKDVAHLAVRIAYKPPMTPDEFQTGWASGPKSFAIHD